LNLLVKILVEKSIIDPYLITINHTINKSALNSKIGIYNHINTSKTDYKVVIQTDLKIKKVIST
jgi:hypothetical protein